MITQQFLQFNGTNIYFLDIEGVYWIAIKPICEALNVNYNRQFQNLKKDEILRPAFALQQMQVGNDQHRKWICLPEFFIYGWIFQIKSKSEELKKYKWKVYNILYNHFKGTITQRKDILKQTKDYQKEQQQIITRLQNNEDYLKLTKTKNKLNKLNKNLKILDENLLKKQFTINI